MSRGFNIDLYGEGGGEKLSPKDPESEKPTPNLDGLDTPNNSNATILEHPWSGLDKNEYKGLKTTSTSFNEWERAVLKYLEQTTPLSTRQRIRRIVSRELERIVDKIEKGTFDSRYE